MEIVRGLEALPLADEPSVVTVGFFDGVHLGHQAVFATTVKRARERGIRSVAVTFDRHPREVLTPGQEPRLLTTVERKASLIEAMGIDVLVVLPFTAAFSRVPAEDFVRDVLVGGIHAVHAAMGANFTFGFKAAGTVETLPAMGEPYGLTAEGVALFELDGRTVSSSSVRDALSAGDLGMAARGAWADGSCWTARSSPGTAVARGWAIPPRTCGRGRGCCCPVRASTPAWPRSTGSATPRRSTSAPIPTFGVEPLHVEAFLLDFEGEELRGKPISIEFWERLRDEIKYDSVEALIEAIAVDVERTRELVDPSA